MTHPPRMERSPEEVSAAIELLPAAEQAYQRVRSLIVGKHIRAGERITEVGISMTLAMSRTPIREALRRLQGDGLLELSGRGLAVAAIPPSQVGQTYAVRAALEALAAESAATRQRDGEVAPAEIARLDDLRTDVERYMDAEDTDRTADANIRFHRYIVDLAANQALNEALGRLWDKIEISSVSNLSFSGWFANVRSQHREIVAAISAGEAARAAAAADHHVRCAAKIYRDRHFPAVTDAEGNP